MHPERARLIDAVHILAANLNRLIEVERENGGKLKSNRAVAAKAGVSSNTIGRMRRADGAVGIGNLSSVAKVFNLSAQQLLTPGLDPKDPPEVIADPDEKGVLKAFRKRPQSPPPPGQQH